MNIWTEYYRQYSGAQLNVASLNDFCAKHLDEIIRDIAGFDGKKVRLSLPGSLAGLSLIDETIRALPFAPFLVISPAPFLQCAAVGDTRLRRLTSFGGAGNCSDGTQPFVWTASFPDLNEWLREARPLLEKGFATYLPIQGWNAGYWSGNNALNLPDNHYDYDRDPVSWQLNEIARDLLVSYRLGCTPVLPKVLGSPALVSSASHGMARALALSALRVPFIRGLTMEQITHVREEEIESFSRFYMALHTALSEIPNNIDSEHELSRVISRIQSDVIDAPLHTLQLRLERLYQHTSYRLLGYTVSAACALAFSFLPPDISVIASATVGGVSLIKLYETLLGMLEQRDKIIKDDQRSYLARLTL